MVRYDTALVPAAVGVMVMHGFLPVAVRDQILDMRQGVLHAPGEYVRRLARLFSRKHRGLAGHLAAALAPQGAGFHHLAAQRLAQLAQINLVAVFARHVDHVQGDDHGNAQLGQLRGQVQVALDVGGVHDVEDGVRPLVYQIAASDHLLQRIGRKAVDAGQVLDDDIRFAFQPALLLFHRHARPVANVLVGTGQVVEHGGFTAVWIARQGDLCGHTAAS